MVLYLLKIDVFLVSAFAGKTDCSLCTAPSVLSAQGSGLRFDSRSAGPILESLTQICSDSFSVKSQGSRQAGVAHAQNQQQRMGTLLACRIHPVTVYVLWWVIWWLHISSTVCIVRFTELEYFVHMGQS